MRSFDTEKGTIYYHSDLSDIQIPLSMTEECDEGYISIEGKYLIDILRQEVLEEVICRIEDMM